jgi:uncharacterized protein (DUF2141 family)
MKTSDKRSLSLLPLRGQGRRTQSFRRTQSLLLAALAAILATSVVRAQGNAGAPGQKNASTLTLLTVMITGLRNRHGQVVVSLFDKAEGFPQKAALATQKIDLSEVARLTPLSITFKNLKPGSYAVTAYHDENKNNHLDSNFLGIPQEDWGMSNNPRPWRMPRFDEARFDLKAPGKTITIPLRH